MTPESAFAVACILAGLSILLGTLVLVRDGRRFRRLVAVGLGLLLAGLALALDAYSHLFGPDLAR